MKALNRTLAVIIAVFGIAAFAGCPDNPGGPSSTWTDVDNDGFDDNTHKHENGTFYDDDGYDWEGYDQGGYDIGGHDVNGYNAKGWHKDGRATNKSGKPYDADGYLRDGTTKWYETIDGVDYDYEGWNELGWNKDNRPLNKNNTYFDVNGQTITGDRYYEGYDVNGLDKGGWGKMDLQQLAGLTNDDMVRLTTPLNNRVNNDGLLRGATYIDLKADVLYKIFDKSACFNVQADKHPDANTMELIDRVKQACDENALGGVRTKTHADDVVTTGVKAISTYIVSMLARMNNGEKDKDFDMTFAERLDMFRSDAYNTFAGISTDMTPEQRAKLFDGLKYDLADAFTIHPEIIQYLLLQIENVEEYFGLRDNVRENSGDVSNLVLADGGGRPSPSLIPTRDGYDFAAVMASITPSTLEPYNP